MQTTDRQPAAQVAEIEIRGSLTSTSLNRVLEEVAAARAAGTCVLLVTLNSTGGLARVGWAIFDALRAFSGAGGRVVTFIERDAGSAAVELALAGDFVVMAPGASFTVHAALWDADQGPDENERARERVRHESLLRIAPRVATPIDTLREWESVTENGRILRGMVLTPEVATLHGWADMPGDKQMALGVAATLAAGLNIPTPRTRMLAGEIERSTFPCPPAAFCPVLGPRRMLEPEDTEPSAQIASDNCLSSGEKPPVKRDYDVIIAEQAGIDTQANAAGVSRSAYDSAVSALTAYLATLTAPTAWNDFAGTTDIVGTTFQQKFRDVYVTRQALLDAISAAKAKTDLSNVPDGTVSYAKLAADSLRTSNYLEDGSGNPTAGAKMDKNGTALKVAPGNLQVGNYVLSATHRVAADGAVYAINVGTIQSSLLGASSATRVDRGASAVPRYVVRIALSPSVSGIPMVAAGRPSVSSPPVLMPVICGDTSNASQIDVGLSDMAGAWQDPSAVLFQFYFSKVASW